MSNKNLIDKLKNNAELAWASYGYFDLAYKSFDKDVLEKIERKENPTITYQDVLNVKYKNYKAIGLNRWGKEEPIGTLKGEFTPTQAKRFSERYELIHHIPNTLSGFSATIFYDIKESNTTTNTKEFKKHFEYIITFRGTEADTKGILSDVLGADVSLATAGVAITQANALELLSKAIFRVIINHHTLSSKKENSHIYDKNLESMQDSYQSYKSIKEYFSSNNIRITTTGHLGDTKTLDSIKVA